MKKQLNISGKTIEFKPLTAKKGLQIVALLADIVDESAPYMALLADSSPTIRSRAMAKMIKLVNLPEKFVEIVSIVTDLPKEFVEDEMTFAQMVEILKITMKLNNWDEFWMAAYSLRIASKRSVVSALVPKMISENS
jgi:hypothetical protein